MFLRDLQTGHLVRVIDLEGLFNPLESTVTARIQAGEEEQEPAPYAKAQMVFPSGESLPRCWTDPDYRH